VPIRSLSAVALTLIAACAACEKSRHRGDEGDLVTAVPSPAVLPKVHLTGADGTEHTVTVEVVREEAELRQGLMHRRRLDPDAGMLFFMGEERIHTFWMRNTYISLDMIFIARDLTVAGIVPDTVPHSDELRYVDAPSVYVLEVNAGWTRARGVVAGARVRFENVRP
jgi:uncharacterized protein